MLKTSTCLFCNNLGTLPTVLILYPNSNLHPLSEIPSLSYSQFQYCISLPQHHVQEVIVADGVF